MPAWGDEFYLRMHIQVDVSVLPCAQLWDIDLNTRILKFESASEHVIFCLSNRHRWKNRTTSSWTNLSFLLWQIINFDICLRNKPSSNPFALLFIETSYIEVRSIWFENSTSLFKMIDLWVVYPKIIWGIILQTLSSDSMQSTFCFNKEKSCF